MAAGESENGRRFFDALGLMGQALALGAQRVPGLLIISRRSRAATP
jgi:hypothetical protein